VNRVMSRPTVLTLTPVLSVGAGIATAICLGASLPTSWLACLFLFSCVLVGLAQQTLP